VSVFWSFMADLWSSAQAESLYGAIAAGGSLGAIAGPALTTLAAEALGTANLLLVSAGFLGVAIACIVGLGRWARQHPKPKAPDPEQPMGGSVLAGIRAALASRYLLGVCAWLLCYTLLSTTLYFQQIEIVGREIADPAERTRLFSSVDLVVNSLTLLTQILLFPRLVAGLGVGWMLALMPLLSVAGFLALGAAPTLAVLLVFGVARRAGEFAISKPARETLFTVVPREEKYKAKNFIDTVVYRGGDTTAGWIFGGLRSLGLSLAAISYAMVPVALAWTAVSLYLGRKNAELRTRSP
jgi:AAA family ATP:ADP antiporter